ncbi:chemotaxis protein CheR [bacterium]|nr:chemotaxis protein CheR [bacterium]
MDIQILNHEEFIKLSNFIQSNFGIKMPEVKKSLLESRLQKRLKLLKLNNFSEYCKYLLSSEGLENELPFFIDRITTNKTDFFREDEHFDYLINQVLPRILLNGGKKYNILKVWSAGCSSGEEPYTLAMVISDFFEKNRLSSIKLSILATDVSQEVLQIAKAAVYPEIRAIPIPQHLKKKYLLKSKSRENKQIKIAPEIRRLVTFGKLNFMDSNYGFVDKFEIIFCRNVIIYFDKITQNRILSNIISHLVTGGYFFQGHSETIQGIDLPLKQLSPTIYIKDRDLVN